MKRSRTPKRARPTSAQAADSEVTLRDVDWASDAAFDVDPVLVENIRARQALKQITLRIGAEQIAEARRVAALTGVPYQAVLRRWLAEGASLSRSLRKAG